MSPQLQAFLAVAQKGTVHQAAIILHITQTGLTQRIKALETQLGISLFERSRKGMRLTHEGEALLRYCHKVLEIEGETLALLEGDQHRKGAVKPIQRVSILGPSSMMRARIIPHCTPLIRQYPQLRLTFEVDDSIEAAQSKLRAAQVQLMVVPSAYVAKELDHKVLKPESYALYVPRPWKKRSIEDIVRQESIIDFTESDHFTLDFLQVFPELEPRYGERHFANNTDALASMISDGLGYSVLAEDFAASLAETHQIEKLRVDRDFKIDFSLAWYPRPEMPSYLRALIDAIF